MDEMQQQSIDYFSTPQFTFWSWQDNGTVVTWRDGTTIAFTREIQNILARLTIPRLPPFGAVLLVLAACREAGDLRRSGNCRRLQDLLQQLDCEGKQPLLSDVVKALSVVQQTAVSLPFGDSNKEDLVAAIFNSPGVTHLSQRVYDLFNVLDSRAFLHVTHPVGIECSREEFLYELGVLLRALAGCSVETLTTRLRTSIDGVVVAALVETPPPQTTSSELLQSLATDQSLAGIARVTRQVLASLNLPRALSDPDELPDGGLSDITNRGSLDRLLLSELAHDDLTLAVRVALKEALYLRREAPPSTPPRQRRVLIDVGLRLWGVPRLFATAVGLAIAIGSEEQFEVDVYRSAGEGMEKVDLSTREGLVRHLSGLDSQVHPGASLQALIGSQDADDHAELVLVTHEEVMEDAEFLRVLSKVPLESLLIATVNRAGQYHLVARSPGGSRLLCEATFDLDDILSPESQRTGEVLLTDDPSELPAIFREILFPLRLSTGVHEERAWCVEKVGAFSLAKDGRLLFWDNPGLGGRQLAEGLPGGHVHWCRTQAGQHYAVVGRKRRGSLFAIHIDLETLVVRQHALQLRFDHPLAFSGQGELVFVIYEKHCEVIDANTGAPLGEPVEIPEGLAWKRDRFFVMREAGNEVIAWHALLVHGNQLHFSQVYAENPRGRRQVATLIDDGERGPLVVNEDGSVYWPINNQSATFFREGTKSEGWVPLVSRDGQWFVYQTEAGNRFLVHSQSLSPRPYGGKSSYLEPTLSQYARPHALRHVFSAIMINGDRQLTLLSRGGERWPLTLSPDRASIRLPRKPTLQTSATATIAGDSTTDTVPHSPILFERLDEQVSNYDLRVAKWSDGSTAILDSRGLLHLRSSDPWIPEFTIVLAEGETAGWVSDGRCWGPKYFVQGHERIAPAQIYRDLFQEFIERLP